MEEDASERERNGGQEKTDPVGEVRRQKVPVQLPAPPPGRFWSGSRMGLISNDQFHSHALLTVRWPIMGCGVLVLYL